MGYFVVALVLLASLSFVFYLSGYTSPMIYLFSKTITYQGVTTSLGGEEIQPGVFIFTSSGMQSFLFQFAAFVIAIAAISGGLTWLAGQVFPSLSSSGGFGQLFTVPTYVAVFATLILLAPIDFLLQECKSISDMGYIGIVNTSFGGSMNFGQNFCMPVELRLFMGMIFIILVLTVVLSIFRGGDV